LFRQSLNIRLELCVHCRVGVVQAVATFRVTQEEFVPKIYSFLETADQQDNAEAALSRDFRKPSNAVGSSLSSLI
jgi:hypothetical protein